MISVALAASAAAVAWRFRWLTLDGAVAASVAGAVILEFGGLRWASALLAFFASGTVLTMIGRRRKMQPEHVGRGRSAEQVIGTGGVAAVISLAWGTGLVPDPAHALLPAAFLGALAASAADTWATELGMLSLQPPRLITNWAYVPAGTSGGITTVGCLAGIGGAVLISAVGSTGSGPGFTAAWIAGVMAMFIDSLLGATVQALFRRPDGTVTESPGNGAVPIRGVAWVTNPVVNLLATLTGALVAAALAYRW